VVAAFVSIIVVKERETGVGKERKKSEVFQKKRPDSS
jgi:hypothetical protein